MTRRGFTTRLKRLKLTPPDLGGPKRLGVRAITSISVSIIVVFFFWFNARPFTMPLTKDLYRTGLLKLWVATPNEVVECSFGDAKQMA